MGIGADPSGFPDSSSVCLEAKGFPKLRIRFRNLGLGRLEGLLSDCSGSGWL